MHERNFQRNAPRPAKERTERLRDRATPALDHRRYILAARFSTGE